MKRYPQTSFSCLADNMETGAMLSAETAWNAVKIGVYIDLNNGMNVQEYGP